MKKIFYKAIISIICFSVIFSSFAMFSMSSYAAETEEDYGQKCYDIMKETGIIGEDFGTYNPDKRITRAEFVKMAWIVANQPIIPSEESVFTDVSENSSYFQYVMSAYERGIVAGSGNSRFQPDSEITLSQALRIITAILGYEEIAQYHGGFPQGYIYVANEYDITDKISANSDGLINMSTAAGLLYNMLNAPLYEIVSIGKYVVSEAYENRTLLTTQYHIYKHSGILSTDAYTDIISPSSDLFSNWIRIGDMTFEDTKNYADEYLGYNVDVFYYDEDDSGDNKSALYVTANKKNTVYQAYSANIYGSGNSIEIYNDNDERIKRLTIKDMVPFIVNGRMKSMTLNDLYAIEKGVFEFISNDGDSSIDLIKVYDFQTYVVSGISSEAGLIQTEDGQRIELDSENSDYTFSITKDDKKILLEEVKVGDVVLIAETTGNEPNKKTLFVCDDIISGEVNEFTEHGIKVDDKEYDAKESIKSKIRLGRPYEFRLDIFGNIVAVTTTDSTVYGYLDSIWYEEFDNVICRIFTENGRWVRLDFAEKITLNGSRKRAEDAYNEIKNSNENVRQLIRYRVNNDAKIVFLETAEETKINSSNEESAIEGNKFRLSYKGELNYRSGHKTFDGKFFLTDSTKIFYVPENYDQSLYRIKSSVSFVADTKYIVQAYDVDENLNAGAILMHKNVNTLVDGIMVVKGKGYMLDSDDNVVPALYVYAYGAKIDLPVNTGTLGVPEETYNALQVGDYIQIAMDDAGLVNKISKVTLVNDKYYFTGTIYNMSSVIAGVVKENDVSHNRIRLSYNEGGDSCGITYDKNSSVYIYSESNETYTVSSITDILENDIVIVRMRYLSGKEILIIRN